MRTDKERQELIRSLNIMDDIFFQKIVEDKEVCEEILQVILQKPRLKVVEAQTQKFLRNIGTHSVILDLICQDEDGSHINVEVQKSDDDDHVKRVRFNISNIDTAFTERGIDYRELPDIYVVFLTRFDVFKERKTIYHLGMSIQETGTPVSDGVHRIFANCAVDDGSDIAQLMQYFKNTEGENRKFPKLSKRVEYFREPQKGEDLMSQMLDEYIQKTVTERMEKLMAEQTEKYNREMAKSFLQNGASAELIRKSIPTLSPDDIEELSKQLSLVK